MLTYCLEGIPTVQCEDDKYALRVAIVVFGDGSELVLASSIPDL
jgi:hypothetical protein